MVCRFILYLSSSCQFHRAVKNSGNSAAGRRENNKRRLGSLVLIKLIWKIPLKWWKTHPKTLKSPDLWTKYEGKALSRYWGSEACPFFQCTKAYGKWKEAKIIRKDPQRPHWAHRTPYTDLMQNWSMSLRWWGLICCRSMSKLCFERWHDDMVSAASSHLPF